MLGHYFNLLVLLLLGLLLMCCTKIGSFTRFLLTPAKTGNASTSTYDKSVVSNKPNQAKKTCKAANFGTAHTLKPIQSGFTKLATCVNR